MKEFYPIKTNIIPLSLIDENEGQIDGVPANPRFITDEKFEDLKKSITDDTEYMNYHPLEVYPLNGRYVSLGGNMRTKALRELGFDSAPCVVFKVDTPIEILKGRILKGNYGYGEWDKTMLAEDWDMAELESWGMEDLVDLEIEDIDGENTPKEDFFDANNINHVVSRGDIWVLGNHRLMCGDSTDKGDFALLMDGHSADISFTSPPYNAGCINQPENETTHQKYINETDTKNAEEYQSFLTKNINILLDNSCEVFYNIGLVAGNKKNIVDLLYDFKENFKDIIYWEKSSAAPCIQAGVINNKVEFIFAFGKNGTRKFQNAQFSQGTWWNVISGNGAGDNEYSDVHKATFPLYLPYKIIESFCPKNGSVIDCFGGTGTTMMAAEQLGRKCYMMELEPSYCDIIIARWEKLTGLKAHKL